MTLLHQAAQKAVEALNHIVRRLQMDIDDGGRPDQWSMEDLVRKAQPAIDAVQSALQQPEQATEPAWGITPATLNRHVSPGITLGHELNRLRQYDAAALQQQPEPVARNGLTGTITGTKESHSHEHAQLPHLHSLGAEIPGEQGLGRLHSDQCPHGGGLHSPDAHGDQSADSGVLSERQGDTDAAHAGRLRVCLLDSEIARRYLCIECGTESSTEAHSRPDGKPCEFIPVRLREVDSSGNVSDDSATAPPALQHQEVPREPVADGRQRSHDLIRQCGGIVHSDGNIFFTNRYQFEHAASLLCGTATVAASPSTTRQQEVGSEPTHEQMMAGYVVACRFGVLEARAFDLAEQMHRAMAAAPSTPENAGGVPAADSQTKAPADADGGA